MSRHRQRLRARTPLGRPDEHNSPPRKMLTRLHATPPTAKRLGSTYLLFRVGRRAHRIYSPCMMTTLTLHVYRLQLRIRIRLRLQLLPSLALPLLSSARAGHECKASATVPCTNMYHVVSLCVKLAYTL